MQRTLEPELMEEQDQVKAYAEADFAIPHNEFIQLIQQRLGDRQFNGFALDLGPFSKGLGSRAKGLVGFGVDGAAEGELGLVGVAPFGSSPYL